MHRAGVDRAGRRLLGFPGLDQVLLRVGNELLPALRRAEVVGLSVIARPMPDGMRIDLHPADRIGRGHRPGLVVLMMSMMIMVGVVVAWPCHLSLASKSREGADCG